MAGLGRVFGLVALCLVAVGAPGCEFFNQPPDVICDDPVLNLTRGECVELTNSRGDAWARGDALMLDGEYSGFCAREPNLHPLTQESTRETVPDDGRPFTQPRAGKRE